MKTLFACELSGRVRLPSTFHKAGEAWFCRLPNGDVKVSWLGESVVLPPTARVVVEVES